MGFRPNSVFLGCFQPEFIPGSTAIGCGKSPATSTFGSFGTCISIRFGTVAKGWKHMDQFLGRAGEDVNESVSS